MDGSITGDAEVSHIDTTPQGRLQTSLHNISLRAIQRAVATRDAHGAVIHGILDGSGQASWKGSLRTLRAQSDLTIRGSASHTVKRETSVPVEGVIHASYDGAHQTVILRDTNLRIPSATLVCTGNNRQSI